ncbi:PP2C family protein-serine/threonine phosphatase [Streptomyces sp. NPDC002896]|uniref:PP2C family protein-serine/threonine phosphatase n=1 Tax=Streptomyces sp. NPDC002896 TaxID=3154438 RepID=UPI00331B75A5
MDRLEARPPESYLRVRGHSIAWILPLAVLAAVVFIDVETSGEFRTISWLVVVPYTAAAVCGVWTTGAYAVLALVMYFLIDNAYAREYQAGLPDLILVALGGVLATVACWVRVREEERMRHMRDVVETTRRTVLRPLPAHWVGLDHAAVYLTADSEARVGGDFYDIQPSPHGPRILVGDVQGKGLGAVAVASALLGSFRESGYHEPDLATVAERLEIRMRRHRGHMALIEAARDQARAPGDGHRAYARAYDTAYDGTYGSAFKDDTTGAADAALDSERFATAVLIGFPPPDQEQHQAQDGRHIQVINFGHEPPLVIGPGGVRELPAGDGLPIGLGELAGGQPTLQRLLLAQDETLLLVTDGVTEARDADGTFFPLREHVAEALADDPGVAEPARLVLLVRDAALRHSGGHVTDDTTVFAVRLTTPPDQPT